MADVSDCNFWGGAGVMGQMLGKGEGTDARSSR